MNFEKALKVELSDIEGLSGKVFPLTAPEGAQAPYVVYESSGLKLEKTLDGFGTSGNHDCTLHIVNGSYGTMKALAGLVEDKVKSFLGRNMATTGPYLQNITFEGDGQELYEREVDYYRKVISFEVFY